MDRPAVLRVVRGNPSDDELVALIAVVAGRASATETPARPRSQWNHPQRLVREPLHPGPGGWVASARPR